MWRLAALALVAMVLLAPLAQAANGTGQQAGKGVAAYLANGFTIAEKRQEKRWLPGVPPYQELKRLVLVTTYRLERGAESVTCETAYDSQQERMTTACQ